MNKEKKKYLVSATIGLAYLALDLLTKAWATSDAYEPVTFIKGFFYLAPHQTNNGIAFGIPLPSIVQIAGSLLILGLLFSFGRDQIFKSNDGYFKPALFGMVIGGALGNLANRVSQGYVADFIVMKPFPVFNVADMGITVGLSLLFLLFLLESKQ